MKESKTLVAVERCKPDVHGFAASRSSQRRQEMPRIDAAREVGEVDYG
jgi:hypothetical protein